MALFRIVLSKKIKFAREKSHISHRLHWGLLLAITCCSYFSCQVKGHDWLNDTIHLSMKLIAVDRATRQIIPSLLPAGGHGKKWRHGGTCPCELM